MLIRKSRRNSRMEKRNTVKAESLGSLAATFPVLGVIWVVCGILMIIVSYTSYQKDYDKIKNA